MTCLWREFGLHARIVLSDVNVEQSIKQVPVDSVDAPVVGHVVGDLLLSVDLWLLFGWRNSLRFSGVPCVCAGTPVTHTHHLFFCLQREICPSMGKGLLRVRTWRNPATFVLCLSFATVLTWATGEGAAMCTIF